MSVQPAGGVHSFNAYPTKKHSRAGLEGLDGICCTIQVYNIYIYIYMTVISPDISQKLCNSVGFSAGFFVGKLVQEFFVGISWMERVFFWVNFYPDWQPYLVGGWTLPLWKMMSSSVGMMTFPTEWKNNVPNHQPDTNVCCFCSNLRTHTGRVSSAMLVDLYPDLTHINKFPYT